MTSMLSQCFLKKPLLRFREIFQAQRSRAKANHDDLPGCLARSTCFLPFRTQKINRPLQSWVLSLGCYYTQGVAATVARLESQTPPSSVPPRPSLDAFTVVTVGGVALTGA